MGASFTGYAVTDIGVPAPQCGRTLRARDDDPSLFRPSLGQEDRSAPVRVCCVRSACLLGRERVIALLTLDLLALVALLTLKPVEQRGQKVTKCVGTSFNGEAPACLRTVGHQAHDRLSFLRENLPHRSILPSSHVCSQFSSAGTPFANQFLVYWRKRAEVEKRGQSARALANVKKR